MHEFVLTIHSTLIKLAILYSRTKVTTSALVTSIRTHNSDTTSRTHSSGPTLARANSATSRKKTNLAWKSADTSLLFSTQPQGLVLTLGQPSDLSTMFFQSYPGVILWKAFSLMDIPPVISIKPDDIMTTYYICLPSTGLGTIQSRPSSFRTRTILS